MDYVQRLAEVAAEYQAEPLLTEIPEIIFSQKDIGFANYQKVHKSGFCNLCAFWLALKGDTRLFHRAIGVTPSHDSIIRFMVQSGTPSDLTDNADFFKKRAEENLQRALKIKEQGKICIDVRGDYDGLFDEFGLFVTAKKQFVDMMAATSWVCAEPGLYYFQVRVFHQQFDAQFHNAAHSFALHRLVNNQGATFFDWRGGVYHLQEKNLLDAVSTILRTNISHYSVGNSDAPETTIITKLLVSNSVVQSIKKRFGIS